MSLSLESQESYFDQNLPQLYRAVLQQFKHISSSFVFFNFVFLSLITAEIIALLVFFPFLLQSTLLAISLSAFFLTVFSYFVLQFYFATKKPEQLLQLKEQLITSCHQIAEMNEGEFSKHLAIATALVQLSNYLEDFEWQIYRIPRYLQPLKKPISLLSAFCHWQDVFRFKEILLLSAIEEHILQVQSTPTSLEVHASLANTYITLSKLYMEPKRSPNPKAFQRKKSKLDLQFRSAIQMAVNEFQIINHFAPNDPWIHEQLSNCYHSLNLPEEEKSELETLLKLRPQNSDFLLRLGMLHFAQGQNALGLKIYNDLLAQHSELAPQLIKAYGKIHQPNTANNAFQSTVPTSNPSAQT